MKNKIETFAFAFFDTSEDTNKTFDGTEALLSLKSLNVKEKEEKVNSFSHALLFLQNCPQVEKTKKNR